MKNLTLLKPDKKTVYLNYGRGQEVNYLNIPPRLTKDALECDVKAGAAQFRECLEFAKKKPSRVVVIECENEEEGMMAVTYLAGIYNCADGIHDEWYLDDVDKMDLPDESSEEAKELTSADYDEIASCFDFDDEEDNFIAQINAEWEEHPCRVPIIELGQLTAYSNHSFVFQENGLSMNGNVSQNDNKPYWLTAMNEPVCIVARDTVRDFGWSIFDIDDVLTKELRRFQKNRHVYVVVVREFKAVQDDDEPVMIEPVSETYIDSLDQNNFCCEVALEYTAGIVEVSCSMKDRKAYYQLLFENWAHAFGKKLEKRFPKSTFVEKIMEMKNPDKSELMEKIYRYVLNEEPEGDILKKENFEILKKFKNLSITTEKMDVRKTIQKMEMDLVGMQDVKRQVYEIVDVMKFNKKRAQMGFGTGGYHNVHMLIGAPGTAKTTIAQMMGNIMCEQKLLAGNRFISINGADLKGMFVGHSAPKTKRYFDDYDIIFIDEAYSLTSENEMDSFSQEALAQLIIELEKHGLDRLVLFAGYGGKHVSEKDNKMAQFLKSNPGIRSRINSTIFFDSYTPDEMVNIVHRQAENQKYQLSHDADDSIRAYFTERVKHSDFGNGREARSLLEMITMKAAVRTMAVQENKVTKKMFQELTAADVEAALNQVQSSYVQQIGKTRRGCGFKMEE